MSFKASAPGSLMLLGEYAVLHGKHALVAAVDKRLTVTLTPRTDSKIIISSALGEYSAQKSRLKIEAPFQFVLTTLKRFHTKMPSGCTIEIVSDFSHQVGFASSAAVTVATLSVLSAWLNFSFSKLELVKVAREIIRKVQGLGSGADVAACVFGGVVLYRAQPLTVKRVSDHLPLTVVYSGSKTPTPEAIARVKHNFMQTEKLYQQICQAIDGCSLEGEKAIYQQNWSELGKMMNIQQGLMDALGVNTPTLSGIIKELKQNMNISGAKISGSGFGDCVIGLGQVAGMENQIPVTVAEQGVYCEEN